MKMISNRSIFSSEKSKTYIQALALAVIDSDKGTNLHFILLAKTHHPASHEHRYSHYAF